MKLRRIALFLILATPVFAAGGKLANLVLYQPNAVLVERLGPDVTPFALYVKKLQAKVEVLAESPEPELLDIVIVIKPGQLSRVWFVSSLAMPPDRSALKRELEAIQPVEVKNGPVAFAMCYSLNNAEPRKADPGDSQLPLPIEWRQKAAEATTALTIPDGFIPLLWPDEKRGPNLTAQAQISGATPGATKAAAIPGTAAKGKSLMIDFKPNRNAITSGVPFPNMDGRPAELRPGTLPTRVRYKFALDDAVVGARDLLNQHLLTDAGGTEPLFDTLAFVQSGAWTLLKPRGGMGLKSSQVLENYIPVRGKMIKFEGMVLRDAGEIANLEKALREIIKADGGGQIRALKTAEMEKWWTYIPFDIEEPTLVIETAGKKHLFILSFAKGKLTWVDELNGLPD